MTVEPNTGNIYQPSQAELLNDTDQDQDQGLYWTDASRGRRFLAYLIDQVCMFILIVGAGALLVFLFPEELIPIYQDEVMVSWLGAGLYLVFYSLVNGVPLHIKGQTLGKMLMKIRIIRMDQQKGGAWRFLGLRFMINQLIIAIPIAGNFYVLIDALFIFREDHRCIHDLIASTRVVNLTPLAEDPFAHDPRFDALPDGT